MELLTIVHNNKIEYIPIIYQFLSETTKHIIFYDHANEEKKIATEIQKSIVKLNEKYGLSSIIEMIKIDEDSKSDMQKIALDFQGNRKNIFLNGSGADITIFTILSSIILRNGGKVIAYDKEDNSFNLISKHGFTNEKISHNLNIEDFLTLMGDKIIQEQDLSHIKDKQQELELLFSDAKRMFKVRNLLKANRTNELNENYLNILKALRSLDIVDKNNILKDRTAYINFGHMFEWFICLQVIKFNFDDIKAGVKICFDDKQVKHQQIEVSNEFDILVIKNNKIGFIECKMGTSLKDIDTVYKSDSIMEYFGEHSSSLIVNIQRDKTPHLSYSQKNFGVSTIFRAKTKKVFIHNAFELGKHAFNKKVQDAFGVTLK